MSESCSRTMSGRSDTDLPRHVEPQLTKLIFQMAFCHFVKPVEREGCIGAAQGDAVALGVKDGGVEIFLGCCKFDRYWPGASDVCNITAVLLYES